MTCPQLAHGAGMSPLQGHCCAVGHPGRQTTCLRSKMPKGPGLTVTPQGPLECRSLLEGGRLAWWLLARLSQTCTVRRAGEVRPSREEEGMPPRTLANHTSPVPMTR